VGGFFFGFRSEVEILPGEGIGKSVTTLRIARFLWANAEESYGTLIRGKYISILFAALWSF
jgi:hypothetical protein